MNGNDLTCLENAHLVGRVMHLDDAASSAVRHAVEVAIDGDHAIAGDAPFEAQYGLERPRRQLLKPRALLRKMLGYHTSGCGVHAHIRHLIEPLLQLPIEFIEIAEAAAEEEVLSDVAIRSLHLPLGLGPVRPARLRQVAVVTGKLEQRPVVDDVPSRRILAAEHGPHAVIEDVFRYTTQGLERSGMTA